MLSTRCRAGMIGFVLMVLSAPAVAAPWVIDFDTGPNNTSFAPNTIFGRGSGTDFQRYDSSAGGIPNSSASVTIFADNKRSSTTPDLAVGFNSDPANGNTRDPDLMQTFLAPLSGNAPGSKGTSGYGNILIVQAGESSFTKSCATTQGAGGTCDNNRADDEGAGRNPGHTLTFIFDQTVRLLGMDVIDTEEGGGMVHFLDEGGNDVLGSPLTAPNVGDHRVGFMEFGTDGILAKTMIVELLGSGAIDNITGDVVATVSEPATLGLFGAGLIALGAYRRRQRNLAARA